MRLKVRNRAGNTKPPKNRFRKFALKKYEDLDYSLYRFRQWGSKKLRTKYSSFKIEADYFIWVKLADLKNHFLYYLYSLKYRPKLWKKLGYYESQRPIKAGKKLTDRGTTEFAKRLIQDVAELVSSKEWELLDSKSQKIVLSCLIKTHEEKPQHRKINPIIEKIPEFVEIVTIPKFATIVSPSIGTPTEEDCIRTFIYYWAIAPKLAEQYKNAIKKSIENGIEIQSSPPGLLKQVVEAYKKAIVLGEFDSLSDIQEIIRDLTALEPEILYGRAHHFFGGLNIDHFSTLCAKLAEVNPELVQAVGEKLEYSVWRNIA